MGVRVRAKTRARIRVRVQQPELTVVVASVVGVGDHVDALLARALGHHEVGATRRRREHEGDAGEAQRCRHGGGGVDGWRGSEMRAEMEQGMVVKEMSEQTVLARLEKDLAAVEKSRLRKK